MEDIWAISNTLAISTQGFWMKHHYGIQASKKTDSHDKISFYYVDTISKTCREYHADSIKFNNSHFANGFHLIYEFTLSNTTKASIEEEIDPMQIEQIMSLAKDLATQSLVELTSSFGRASSSKKERFIVLKSDNVSFNLKVPISTKYCVDEYPNINSITFFVDEPLDKFSSEDYLISNLSPNLPVELNFKRPSHKSSGGLFSNHRTSMTKNPDTTVNEQYLGKLNVTSVKLTVDIDSDEILPDYLKKALKWCKQWNLQYLEILISDKNTSVNDASSPLYHFNNPTESKIEEIVEMLETGIDLQVISTIEDCVKIE